MDQDRKSLPALLMPSNSGAGRRAQLLAAVSVLGVSLGMSTAHAGNCASGEHCDNSSAAQANSGTQVHAKNAWPTTIEYGQFKAGDTGATNEKITLHHEGLSPAAGTTNGIKIEADKPTQNANSKGQKSDIELHSWSWGASNAGANRQSQQGGMNAANKGGPKTGKPGVASKGDPDPDTAVGWSWMGTKAPPNDAQPTASPTKPK